MESAKACPLNGDDRFGPRVDPICRGFDFTLLFEDIFFSALTASLLLLLMPVRIRLSHQSPVKMASYKLAVWKLVREIRLQSILSPSRLLTSLVTVPAWTYIHLSAPVPRISASSARIIYTGFSCVGGARACGYRNRLHLFFPARPAVSESVGYTRLVFLSLCSDFASSVTFALANLVKSYAGDNVDCCLGWFSHVGGSRIAAKNKASTPPLFFGHRRAKHGLLGSKFLYLGSPVFPRGLLRGPQYQPIPNAR